MISHASHGGIRARCRTSKRLPVAVTESRSIGAVHIRLLQLFEDLRSTDGGGGAPIFAPLEKNCFVRYWRPSII